VNIVIEQGNTCAKVGIYNKGIRQSSSFYADMNAGAIIPLLNAFEPECGIMSSVIKPNDELLGVLRSRLKRFIWLDECVPVPVQVQYRTPSTLGKDRLAAVVGASYLKPRHDLLVIDAGTAITYDIVNAAGSHVGGNISPGLTTRFRSLNQFTDKLPLVSEAEDVALVGNDTETAIRSGVVNGIVCEMDGMINKMRMLYPKLFVFLTGGHSFYFERRLENTIFADINLVLTGLNRILEYNVDN
jgi:type III pantothenate kinase